LFDVDYSTVISGIATPAVNPDTTGNGNPLPFTCAITATRINLLKSASGITENINLSNINLYYAGVGKINVDYGAIKKELKVDSTGTDEYDFAREEVRMPAKWMPAKKTRIEIRSGYDFEVKAIQFEYTTNTRYE
jgi:hypothetical protein